MSPESPSPSQSFVATPLPTILCDWGAPVKSLLPEGRQDITICRFSGKNCYLLDTKRVKLNKHKIKIYSIVVSQDSV